MAVILYPVINRQRLFANVTLGRSFKFFNLLHCQSLHGLYIHKNFFEVLGKFLQFLHEPFCRLRPSKAAILGQRVIVTTLQVVSDTECFMLLVSIFISRRFQQTLKIGIDNERYSLLVGQVFEAQNIVLRRWHVDLALVYFCATFFVFSQFFFGAEVVKTAVTDTMLVTAL